MLAWSLLVRILLPVPALLYRRKGVLHMMVFRVDGS